MMQRADLLRLKSWFADYAHAYLCGQTSPDRPLVLKIDHTARVCANMRLLARNMGFPEDHVRVAEAIGLLHDLGRFEQYRRYQTFNDRNSVNHAALAVGILSHTAVLSPLEAKVQQLIKKAVRFHNAPHLPSNMPPLQRPFMRMIRDADKLDIWKIFADAYRSNQAFDPTITLRLPDLPNWTPAVIEAIHQKRMARFQDMRTLNDFKLLQLSWVFDLNFAETFIQAGQRGDLKAIARSLPQAPEIERTVAIVMHHLAERIPSEQQWS